MNRFLFSVVFIVLGVVSINAQDYNDYLYTAQRHLTEGNTEKAKMAYSVYCDLSNLRDLEFEKQLDWKNKCYILGISDTTVLAVQKISVPELVSYEKAVELASNSNLGAFTDWRLPDSKEGKIIVSNLSQKEFPSGEFWLKMRRYSVGVATYTVSGSCRKGGPFADIFDDVVFYESDYGQSMDKNGRVIKYAEKKYDGKDIISYSRNGVEIGSTMPVCNYFIVRMYRK